MFEKRWPEVLDQALADPTKRRQYLGRRFSPSNPSFSYLRTKYDEIILEENKSIPFMNRHSRVSGTAAASRIKKKDLYSWGMPASIRASERYRQTPLQKNESPFNKLPFYVDFSYRRMHRREFRRIMQENLSDEELEEAAKLAGISVRQLDPDIKATVRRQFQAEVGIPIADAITRARIVQLAAKAAALEDFLKMHPANLVNSAKARIVTEIETLWNLTTHPLIQGILQAESDLRDIFDEFSASDAEKARFTAEFASRKSKENARIYIKKQLEKARRPTKVNSRQEAKTSHSSSPARLPTVQDQAIAFAQTLTHLEPKQQQTVAWAIRRLHEKGIFTPTETIHLMKLYADKDHHVFDRF